jgi:hypothetical protein
MNKLTETEKAYIAGLLDGEGCVGISKKISPSKKHPFNFGLRVIITNSNYQIICWLKEKTGIGCAYEYDKKPYKPNWNPIHRWQVVCEQARNFLNEIYPYIRIKKEIIDLVLDFPQFQKIYKGKNGRSLEVYEKQEILFDKAKAKNKRGKAIIKEV